MENSGALRRLAEGSATLGWDTFLEDQQVANNKRHDNSILGGDGCGQIF